MDITHLLTEYKLLGTLLAITLGAIAYLHNISERDKRKFAAQTQSMSNESNKTFKAISDENLRTIKSINDDTNRTNQIIADKFVALHTKTMQDFKDMHARSLEIIGSSISKHKD